MMMIFFGSCYSQVPSDADLKEHMVGIIFSRSKLTNLQKQVFGSNQYDFINSTLYLMHAIICISRCVHTLSRPSGWKPHE